MKYLHTMVRVTDLEESLDFYCNKLGLVELRRHENEQGRYTLVFLAAPGDEDAQAALAERMRERIEELEPLIMYFLEKFRDQYDRPKATVPQELIAEMKAHHWPGNVRELENYMKRIVVIGDVDGVRREMRASSPSDPRRSQSLLHQVDPKEFEGRTLREVSKEAAVDAERAVLERVLEVTRWNRRLDSGNRRATLVKLWMELAFRSWPSLARSYATRSCRSGSPSGTPDTTWVLSRA